MNITNTIGIRAKLLLPLFALVFIIVGSVEFYWIPNLTEREKLQRVKAQQTQLGVLEVALVDPMLNSNMAQLHVILDEVISKYPEWKWIELRTPEGKHLYPLTITADIAEGDHVYRLKHDIDYIGSTLGTLSLSADLSVFVEDFERELRVLDWLLLVLMPMVAGISALLQDRFVRRPLHKLAGAATRIAHGDFNVQLPKASSDEVGQLVHAFRGMCEMRNTAQSALEKLAYFDILTRLPNRAMFKEHLTKALTNAENNNRNLSLLFIDLDRFKVVNDTLGHEVGDLLLIEAASRIEKCIHAGDLVARLGGDEFTVVLDERNQCEASRIVAKRIVAAFKKPFEFSGQKPVVCPSIGISLFPEHAQDYGTMMQCADTAMYKAKELGGNCFKYYSPEMGDKLTRNMNIEAGLRRALTEDEFVLHYQPKIELASGRITGVEALIRWIDPEQGMIAPDNFIPLAEETGLIIPIGEWVLRKACEQHAEWGSPDIEMAINLSANHLYDAGLFDMLQATLQETGFKPELLELEITENAIMENARKTITILERIKSLGVKVAIDDFGTGYSSLSYLKRFAIDTIKIDRSFIKDIPYNTDDVAITSATVAMAHKLRRRVVAEGIETKEQAEFLTQLGSELGQGFYYSKPLEPMDMKAMLQNNYDCHNTDSVLLNAAIS